MSFLGRQLVPPAFDIFHFGNYLPEQDQADRVRRLGGKQAISV
jgi:hypothetical protein